MDNLKYGILSAIVCTIVYYLAYRCYRRNNYGSAILLILLGGLILRIYAGTDMYLHTWDEKYHALVAKNLLLHPLKPTLYDNPVLTYNFRNWVGNHVWLDKPPIPLWFISLFLKWFGLNEIVVRLPSIIMSTLAVFLTFSIGKILYNKKVALLGAFFHSINGLLIELAGGRISSDHVETSFIFFVELAILIGVYMIYKKKSFFFSFLVGLVMGVSLLCKWSPGLIVAPIWLAGAFFSRKYEFKILVSHFVVIVITGFVIFFTWIYYSFEHFPEETKWVLSKFIFAYKETLEEHRGPWYYYINHLGIVFGEIAFIPLAISLYFLFKKKMDWKLVMLTLWWLIPVMIFSFAETKRSTYMLISAPAFFIVISFYWFYIRQNLRKVKYKPLMIIVLILLILLPVRYSIERTKVFLKRERNPAWSLDVKNIGNKISTDGKSIIFNIERPIEAMFYNDCVAYKVIPNDSVVNRLIAEGYHVYINIDGETSLEQFRNSDAIQIKLLEKGQLK